MAQGRCACCISHEASSSNYVFCSPLSRYMRTEPMSVKLRTDIFLQLGGCGELRLCLSDYQQINARVCFLFIFGPPNRFTCYTCPAFVQFNNSNKTGETEAACSSEQETRCLQQICNAQHEQSECLSKIADIVRTRRETKLHVGLNYRCGIRG